MEKLQEMFDALVAEFGAEAVVQAVKSHNIKPLAEGCTPTSCPKGYYCDTKSGTCVLNVGI